MKKEKKRGGGPDPAAPGARKNRKGALAAAQLAPQEELGRVFSEDGEDGSIAEVDLDAADEEFVDGSVILDGQHIDLPRQMVHPESDSRRSRFNPVLVVVLTISVSFTAFIAYLISVQ